MNSPALISSSIDIVTWAITSALRKRRRPPPTTEPA